MGCAEGKPRASEGAEKQRVSEKGAKREKTTVCEILGKQLVLFESEVADKIRNRDAFFSAIERRCNDVVIEGAGERIAVEKSYWQQFLEKLSKIKISSDDEVKKQLDPLDFKLFKVLKESALIIFDANEKKWELIVEHSKKSGKKQSEEEDYSWLLQYAPEPEET